MKPITVSWSQIRTFEECRQKLHLVRGGHRSPAQNLRNFYHGMVVDRVMRTWLADPNRQSGQMADMVPTEIERGQQEAIASGDGVVRWRHVNDKAEVSRFCTALVIKLELILATHVLPHPFECGKNFRIPIKIPYVDGSPTTITLIGEMDLLVQTPAGPVVWDLKGTQDDGYWRKVLGQLVFYDLAVYADTGKPTAGVGLIQPMCKEPLIGGRVTDDQRREMLARVIRLANGIWTLDQTCKATTTGCNYCEVNHACPRYQAAWDSFGQALDNLAKRRST